MTLSRQQRHHLAAFARNFGTGEVFAIYPAGKAVRGAEWKEPS